MTLSLINKLLQNVMILPSGCWFWTAYKDRAGYGTVRVGSKKRKAHRVMHEQIKGEIPAGLLVCHSCDNPSCVNPAHLWVGSSSENILDAVAKGRWTHTRGPRESTTGELNPRYKHGRYAWRNRGKYK